MEKKFTKAYTPPRYNENEIEQSYQKQQQQQIFSTQKLRNRLNSINETQNVDFSAFSTSPPNLKFQIGSSPSSNKLLETRGNLIITNNVGDPILIDDLEEETILDVNIYFNFFPFI